MLDRRLRYFLAVVEHGSFRAAGVALGISQPALTKAIREFEIDMGTTLFERHARGVRLSAAGQSFARRAMVVALEERHARAELAALRDGDSGSLRVGAGPVWACRYLPGVIAPLERRYPLLRVVMRVGNNVTLHPLVAAGDLDICFGSIDDVGDVKPDVVYEPLADVAMTVYARAGHPLAVAGGEPGLGDLARYPWVSYQGDPSLVRRLHDRFLSAGQEPPRVAVESSSLLSCFGIVSSGDFLFSLGAPLAAEAGRHGLVALPVTLWRFRSGAWLHASARSRPAVRDLMKLLRQSVQNPATPPEAGGGAGPAWRETEAPVVRTSAPRGP